MLQISSIRSPYKLLPAWRRGATLRIWVQALRPPSAHVSVQSSVSAASFFPPARHTCVSFQRRLEKQRMWDLWSWCIRTDCVATVQPSIFNSLSCALNHPLVFFCLSLFPHGPPHALPTPPWLTAPSFSLTHTLFPFQ